MHHTTLFFSLDAAPTATAWGFTILVLALGTGCSEFDDADPAAYTDEEVIESTRFHGGKNLFWQNVTTGEVSAWVLNGNKVTGTQALDWRCGAGDDCVYQWRPIETGYATILWHNATSGVLQSWRFDGNGIVKADPQLTWRCDAASGCSSAWRAIGKVEFSCCDSDGLLWHNAQTGEVGAWDLAEDDYTVQGKYTLPWKCGPGDGCSQKWEAMLTADFNHDANDDVLWYNRTTGQVSAWLLKGAKITGTQELAWPCDIASGCAQAWRIVDAADVNSDGKTDLTWHNSSTGEVSSWLLDGNGGVSGTSKLDWTCDSTCSSDWKAIGFGSFPH
jgi:hypothetical protein